jgi:hypothetical protein
MSPDATTLAPAEAVKNTKNAAANKYFQAQRIAALKADTKNQLEECRLEREFFRPNILLSMPVQSRIAAATKLL